MVSMKAIAQHFEDTIQDHSKMKIKEIQRRIQSEIHVNVPKTRCKRAEKSMTSRLAGSCKEIFDLLWNYVDELQSKNLGSTVKMAVNKVLDIFSPHVKRFYVYFDAIKRGWKEGCGLITGLDGCFLKGPFKGVLLTTVGRIGNDQMYLIAWVVVEGETTDSWSWFLSLVSTDLEMEDGFNYTIISDQHKGLKVAINDILPRIEHRNCARHVYVNSYERKKEKTFQYDF
ncbi:hypothetical protein V6N13_071901 [Hibiscus sabdariffa]